MTQYDNTNRGALFINDRKTPGSKQPDYKGSINIAGVEYWLSGWVKDTSKGEMVSLSVEPKDGPGANTRQNTQTRAQGPRTLGGHNQQQSNQTPNPSAQQGGWGSNPSNQGGEPPMDFDDDIPF